MRRRRVLVRYLVISLLGLTLGAGALLSSLVAYRGWPLHPGHWGR